MNLAGIKVTWTYGTKEVPVRKAKAKHEMTTCHVQLPNTTDTVTASVSKHHNDQINWEKARVLTLSRALLAANIDRATRTEVWLAYNNTKPGGRW